MLPHATRACFVLRLVALVMVFTAAQVPSVAAQPAGSLTGAAAGRPADGRPPAGGDGRAVPPPSDHGVAALERAAVALAATLRAVPVRDGPAADPARSCPTSRLVVSWIPPVGRFHTGAYIPPLGPAPTARTTHVTGVVLCRGATYAYMGFEATRSVRGW